jgi:acyl carrier protein
VQGRGEDEEGPRALQLQPRGLLIHAAAVRELILARWPGRFTLEQLGDDVSLGEQGLGLDSIEIVELLLDCDDRFGSTTHAEELLEAGPISVGRLIEQLSGR